MTILPFRDRTYTRFISGRTRETLFEITMLHGSITVWGKHYRPSEFRASLAADGATVTITGTLSDRVGPVVTFGEYLVVAADFRVESGVLPADFDPGWKRDRT